VSAALERQLALLALLAGTKQPLDQTEVFDRLPNFYPDKGKQATRRKAFARDLEVLQTMGAAILAEDKAGNGVFRYRLMPESDGLPRDFRLSEEEAKSLRGMLLTPMAASQLAAPARQVLVKLLSFHSPFDEKALGEESDAQDLTNRCEKLRACAREGRACTITYPDHQGNPERRDISPGGLFFRFGEPYCAGLCHRSDVVKAFKVAKIEELRLSKQPGRPLPADFDLGAFASRNAFRLGAPSEAVKARLRVLPEEAWRLKERMPGSVVSEDKAGIVVAEIEVAAPERFFKFVLSFGEFAEILGPPKLRQDFVKHLEGPHA
jgi:predicted DNA-binding transcriptional regulator YafY